MRHDLPGERNYRQMRVRLDFEQISDGAHDQAVEHESGSKGGKSQETMVMLPNAVNPSMEAPGETSCFARSGA
jgi:hypothetical protein